MTNSFASTFTIGDIAVRQLDGLFSLNDLHKASGGDAKHEPNYFVRLDSTQALVSEISKSPEMGNLEPIKSARGRNGGTYGCREVVIAYAAWISAVFHLKVIRVFLNAVAPAEPRIAYSVNPGDTLTAAQAEQLRLIFKDKCDTLPKEEQAAFMTKGWSKLKSHFGVTYRKIEQREFSEAISMATRHAAEWTLPQLPAPAPVERTPERITTKEDNRMSLDVRTLCSMISGGLIDQRAFQNIAYTVNQHQFKLAASSKPTSYAQDVADKLKTLSGLDLHTITVAATMETLLRTEPPAAPAAVTI